MKDHIPYLKLLFAAGKNHDAFQQKLSDFYPALIYIYDLEVHKLVYVNKKLTEILGYPVEEFHNIPGAYMNIVYKDDVEFVKHELKKFYSLNDQESHSFDVRLNHQNGSWRMFKTLGTVWQRNDIDAPRELLFIAQDITEEVKTEQENAATRELFTETEHLLQFGSWSWNAKTNKILWTPGMYELLEYGKHEVQEVSHAFFMKHVAEEDAAELKSLIEKALSTRTELEHEFVINTRTRKQKIVSIKFKVLADPDGNLQGAIGITRDVTSLKNIENERDRIIRELNRSNKELEEFAYIASHDLQEPLRKILAFSEKLKRYEKNLDVSGNQYLDRIFASAVSMRNLIGNLLEFSKVSRSSLAFEPCNLNDLLREVITDLELRIEETATVLHVRKLPVIDAVPSEMRQLFNNLISNALKFRKNEADPVIQIYGKKLTHTDKTKHYLPVNRTYYQVDVCDNGIGFEPQYAEKIFEIFQRLHGKTDYVGSGIGLAICKKIVDNHGGIIFAASTPGEGSTFSVILPEKQ